MLAHPFGGSIISSMFIRRLPKSSIFILLSLVVALVWLLPTSAQSLQNTNGLKIGAKLKQYKRPAKRECDINVPNDYGIIQDAVNAASDGNTVCVEPGVYDEDVLVNKPLTLSGYGFKNNKHSVINGQSIGIIIAADDIVVEGFEINGIGPDYTKAALIIGEALTNVAVRYNQITAGNGALAIRADGGQNNHLIQSNVLQGDNSPQVAMINGTPSVGKASNKVDFLSNTFTGTVNPTARGDTGVVLAQQAADSLIQYNVFNTTGIVMELIQNAFASVITGVNYNNFNSSALLWKVSNGVGTLNAGNNWWGDTNPIDDVRNTAVDFEPFAMKPYHENK
jgi:hypothetical protein